MPLALTAPQPVIPWITVAERGRAACPGLPKPWQIEAAIYNRQFALVTDSPSDIDYSSNALSR
jgi:hypothetical protein